MPVRRFRRMVWAHYKKYGRHTLPWRRTKDPYKILVSEIMLQQTQVDRVIPFYTKFIKKFPTARALARAPLSAVLKAWQGLGYNRRVKMLQKAAKEIIARHGGIVPRDTSSLEALSGVGSYTARAVAAFAFNQDVTFVETNIRTAVIHHFFTKKNTTIYRSIPDSQVQEVLEKALPKGKAREWYSALMDYGAHLKRSGVRVNAHSSHYTKQPTFTGSLREARGTILRAYLRGVTSRAALTSLLGDSRRAQAETALRALIAEGLVSESPLSGARSRLPRARRIRRLSRTDANTYRTRG